MPHISLAELGDLYLRVRTAHHDAAHDALVDTAGSIVDAAVEEAESARPYPARDTGAYIGAFRVVERGSEVSVRNAAPHARAIEYGRAPGPVGAEGRRRIEAWAARKGMAAAAGAIVKKIEREGFEPRRVLFRALERVKEQLPSLFAQALRRRLP